MDSEVSSIRDLKPLETGGVVARVGMGLQDHVAAGFCIRMLSDPSLLEVWCERQDDVTLLWSDGKGKERVEFVQVKSTDQAWTPKNLCAGEPSVLERLLANDRAVEACCFRMVTTGKVDAKLKVLTYPPDGHYRQGPDAAPALLALQKELKDSKSPNGNDVAF